MQPVFPTLPEFDLCRNHPDTAPERRQRNLPVGELALHLIPFHLEKLARIDHRALLRNPGPQTAAVRTRGEIGEGFGGTDPLGSAEDADLPLQRIPRKKKTDVGVRRDIAGLAALVIGEKDKTPLVISFEQHGAGARTPTVGRGQDHGIGFDQFRRHRLAEPLAELGHRILSQIGPAKTGPRVIAAQFGHIGVRGCGHA